jgi:dihydroorotase
VTVYDLIIRDATIIRSGGRVVADIAIEDGRIAHVGGNPAGGTKEDIPGIGRFVIPGVIDSQVRFRKPGDARGRDWGLGSRAAVRSGVTTVVELPDGEPGIQSAADVKAALDGAAKAAVCNVGVWVGITRENFDQVGEFVEAGAAAPLIHLDHGEGPLCLDEDHIRAVMRAAPGIVGVHAEDPALLAKGRRKWEAVEDPQHNDVRTPKAARASVERLIEIVKEVKRPVHLTSFSTSAELNLLDPHRGDLPISCSVAPHHLFLSVETSAKAGDTLKVNPPVRGELDRRALWSGIKRGRIDTFHSAHTPLSKESKSGGYWSAPEGLPGVDVLFLLLMSAVKHGRISLERLVEMCCEAPAEIFGLTGKGSITEGADADLVVFSEGETTRLRKAPTISGVNWSPYVGREVGIPPRLVLVGGRVVSRDGELVEDLKPAGRVQFNKKP